jgi:tRNA uridine 5-carboxymethylaminomethyl modification enzyme
MFTSRAEHRLILRQDNADARLSKLGFEIGLLNESNYERFQRKINYSEKAFQVISNYSIKPDEINPFLISSNSSSIRQKSKISTILSRPQINIEKLIEYIDPLKIKLDFLPHDSFKEILQLIEIKIKYAGYIDRENTMVSKIKRLENIEIGNKFDYSTIQSISTEAREKLMKINPLTIGQAARIPGISPNDINVLLILMGR